MAGAVWAAALLGVFLPAAAAWCGGVSICALVIGAVLMRPARPTAPRGALAIVILAGVGAVSISVIAGGPGRDDAAPWGGRVVEIEAVISSSASIGQDGRLWVDADLVAIGPPGRPHPASAPIRVGIDPDDGFDLGASIRVTGEAGATDPGERAALLVFASSASVERPASGVFALAAGLRSAFIDRAASLPEPGAGLLPGLAVGDTRAVSTELSDDMRASGLSHLTAVSGANCAIVVGAMFWLAAICGAARWLRILVAALALAGFVVLVTPEPSVVRAAVMAGVAMLSILIGRPSAGAGMLALSATVILIADPWLASTPGFALSVAASGALILLAPVLARGLARWLPTSLAVAIAVPTSAQLVCGPIIALFAEQQSLVGIAANLLAAPAAPVATVIGLLACLSAPLPALADVLAASAWPSASWIAATATVSAELPLGQILLPPGLASAAAVGVVSASVAVLLVDGVPRMRVARAIAGGIVVILLALGGSHLLLTGPLARATTPDAWSIAACDVGQGDAVLLRSQGDVALIDTGPEPEALAACLRGLGIDRIDLLVLTHFDLDHVGGIDAVEGRVDRVLHGPPGGIEDERILTDLERTGADIVDAAAGLQGGLGAAEWRVLWPTRGTAAFPSGNDASVILAVDGGGIPRSLFLGDLSAEAQRSLLRSAPAMGAFIVVKVAHHGSADQDAGLYESIRPDVALITVGKDNDYGHPRDEILAILQQVDAHLLRTDLQGRILLGVRGGELEVWTSR